jgi:hypothetical protein
MKYGRLPARIRCPIGGALRLMLVGRGAEAMTFRKGLVDGGNNCRAEWA